MQLNTLVCHVYWKNKESRRFSLDPQMHVQSPRVSKGDIHPGNAIPTDWKQEFHRAALHPHHWERAPAILSPSNEVTSFCLCWNKTPSAARHRQAFITRGIWEEAKLKEIQFKRVNWIWNKYTTRALLRHAGFSNTFHQSSVTNKRIWISYLMLPFLRNTQIGWIVLQRC